MMKRREMLQTTLGVGALALCPSLLFAKGNELPVAKFSDPGNIDTLINRDEVFGKWELQRRIPIYEPKLDKNEKQYWIENSKGQPQVATTGKEIGRTCHWKRDGWVWIDLEDQLKARRYSIEKGCAYIYLHGLVKLAEYHSTLTNYFNHPRTGFKHETTLHVIVVTDASKATNVGTKWLTA